MRMEKTAALVCVIVLAITCIAFADSGNSVCLSPPDVAGAIIPEFSVTEHPIGTAVIYNCPPGYASLNLTNQISLCRNNTANGKAEWTLPNITCKRNSVCSSPPDVDGAVTPQFKASEHPVGTAVIYNCPSNYVSLNVTNLISLCTINTENGKAEWTSPKMSCERGCEIPEIPGGSFKTDAWKYEWNWQRFRYDKIPHYVVVRSRSTVSSGTVLWFYCDEPYSVNGYGMHRLRTRCRRGSITKFRCLREPDILCPPADASGDFTLLYSNHRKINSTVTFFCRDNGTRMEGSNSLNCLPNGTWSGQTPKCVGTDILCPPIDSSRTFTLQYSNHRRVNSTVTFFCKDNGQRIEGSSSLNCLPNGTWSGRNPKCVDVMCEEPQPPKHGTVKLHGDLKVGSLATYSCGSGRKLNGDNTAVCLISGQWTFDAPECLSVAECVLDLGPFPRLLVNPMKDVYRVGETISLSCPPGEVMSSQVYRIMCLPSGWTDSFPNCIKLNKEH